MEPIRQGELHPLENAEVLQIIFEKSTLSDLKNYRQVCRTWMLESSRAMRAVGKLVINGDRSDEEGLEGLSAFLALVDNELSTFTEAPPVDSVRMMHVHHQDPEFWTVFGSHIKILKMEHVDFENAEQFRQAIFVACPNLTELELYRCSIGGPSEEEPAEYVPPRFPVNRNLTTLTLRCELGNKEFSVSWMEFFSQFPSLEVLNVTRFGVTGNTSSLFRSLGVARQHDNTSWNLTNLNIDLPALQRPLETVEILANAAFTLTKLKVGGVDPGHEIALRQILTMYGGSLKKLELYGSRVDGPLISTKTFFPLPNDATLRNLSELELFCDVFDSMDFLRFVPALKKLTIGYCRSFQMVRESNENDIPPLEHCTDVKFPHVMWSAEPEDIRKLNVWLPNIKKLQITRLSNESFASLCELWPSLEWLEICCSDLDDSGITGLDDEDVERINREGKSGNWKPITVPRANITSLKNLKRLSLRVQNLGHASAAHGVELLPQLQQFQLPFRTFGDLVIHGDTDAWDQLIARYPWKSDWGMNY